MTVTQVQTIVLAGPRGFCAGVDRAIDIVELALQVCPPPIYVRKEIVHNRHVVEALRAKGAHFVDELDEVPDNINDKHDIRAEWLDGASRVGVTAGASTPEFLVSEVVEALGRRQSVAVQEVHVVEEDVRFGLPRELEDVAKAAGKTLPPRSGVRVSEE